MSDDAADNATDNDTDLSGYVPKDRFAQVTKQRREALAQLAEIREENERLRQQAQGSEELRARVSALQQERDNAHARYERHVAISGAGITDPSIVEYIEYQHGKLGDKAPKIGDYVSSLVADPAAAPAVLRPHLEALRPNDAANATSTPAPSPRAAPNPHVGVQPTPKPTTELTPTQIAHTTDAEWKALRAVEMEKRRKHF